jgi:hypothetical protein
LSYIYIRKSVDVITKFDSRTGQCELDIAYQGRIQDFKIKKLRRAEGGAKIFGVFRVKNHDFTPKKHIFPILGGAREIYGVFHVKNHDFTPKKIIFLPILGGRAPGAPPPESAPAYVMK